MTHGDRHHKTREFRAHHGACGTEVQETVQTFLQHFMSNETRKAYVSDWRVFFEFLEKEKIAVSDLNEITESHVIRYRDFMRVNFSATTINRRLSALSSLFSQLKDAQVMKKNPAGTIRRPKAIAKKKRTGFTDKEVNQILESINASTLKGLNDKAILSFLFFTGARVSEALNIRVKDIDTREGIPVIHLTGKGERVRTLPVVKVYKLLKNLIELRTKGSDDYVFTPVKSPANKKMSRVGVHKLIKMHLKKLDLDPSRSAHSTRRTVISNLLECGERLELVQKVAGHSSPNVTLRSYNVREEPLSKNPLLSLKYKE